MKQRLINDLSELRTTAIIAKTKIKTVDGEIAPNPYLDGYIDAMTVAINHITTAMYERSKNESD